MLTVKDFLQELDYDKKARKDVICLHEPAKDTTETYQISDLTEKDLWKFVISFQLGKDNIYKLVVV